MQWDVFCRVIDNFGDIGFAWRLSADIASRGECVRLWVDDTSALAWMAPRGCPGVELVPWIEPTPDVVPGDVVVETLGCDPPTCFVQAMLERKPAPVWINLDHLSAEIYAQRSHGLPSPVTIALGHTLSKNFYFPGFVLNSGGLLREPTLLQQRQCFDRALWLYEHGIAPAVGERLVSLFCYTNPCLPALLETLATTPTLLLVTPGAPTQQVNAALGPALRCGALRAQLLPYFSQSDYDRLLWACDLNFVRGEDSFVRAQWAARPFVWQIYPQHDGAHAAKLEAFLSRLLAHADDALAAQLRRLCLGWNGLAPAAISFPEQHAWQTLCARWCAVLAEQADLVTQLLAFVARRRDAQG